MIDPRVTESALDAMRPGWRQRRERRKSPWNLFCVALGLVATYFYSDYLSEAAAWLNIRLYPEHSFLTHHFLSYLDKHPSPFALLMVTPLFVPALTAGLLTANVLTWLIPPARRAMELEAHGDKEMTFAGSNLGLIKYGGIVSAVCFLLSAIGIFMFRT